MIFTNCVDKAGNVNDLLYSFLNLRALVAGCITNKEELKLVATKQPRLLSYKDLLASKPGLEKGLEEKAKIIQQMKDITLGVDDFRSALFNLRADNWSNKKKRDLEGPSLPLHDGLSMLVDQKSISCDISTLIRSTNEYIKSMQDNLDKFKSELFNPKNMIDNSSYEAILNENRKRLQAHGVLSEQVNKLEAYFSPQNVPIKLTDIERIFKAINNQISILENSVTPVSQYNSVTHMIQPKGSETRTPRVYS